MYTLSITDTVVEVILSIGQSLKTFLQWIISFLPDDPFNLTEVLTVPQSVRTVLGFVNWLIPLGRCIQLIVIWFSVALSILFIKFALKFIRVM